MPAGGSRNPPALIQPTSFCISMGTLSCAGAGPCIAHKATLAQNAAEIVETNFRPNTLESPFFGMGLILRARLALCRMQIQATQVRRLGCLVMDDTSRR